MSSRMVSVGTFFFRHRNWAFPALVGGFFAAAIPPATMFGSEAAEHVRDGAAVLVAASGLALRGLVIGGDHVRRAGEGRAVHASRLFTEGMFSLCRNPLYTGNMLVFLGIFLMHGNAWTVVLGSACYAFIYRAIVAAEESYLRHTFGDEYLRYMAAVPRWLPNPLRIRRALAGRPLNWRRVLLVEYPNIGVTALVLALAEFYEEWEEPVDVGTVERLTVLGAIMGLAVAFVLAVRLAKKRRLIVAG